MVFKKNRVNIAWKDGRLDPKRDSKYYIIEEFLSNGCVILKDLHLNMVDPVLIPQGHLKKIVPEDMTEAESEDDQHQQGSNRKRKWNMTTNTNVKMNVTMTEISDTEFMEGIDDTANTSNTGMNTDANMDISMNAKPNSTSNEHMAEMGKEGDEEGIDHDVIFTSDKGDNIFDNFIQEDTLGYIDSNDGSQIVDKTKHTFNFQPLAGSSREEVGPLVQITKFKDIPFTGIGQELRGLPRRRELMKGDGICYFRAISFAILGKQDYYDDVRKVICEYIENFPGKLNAVSENAHNAKSGCEYIEIFTYFNYRWQRHSYIKSLSPDAIYLNNRAGNDFDVILAP